MPVLVALSRMYRGEHHPTDILGSLLFAALWLTATYVLIRPTHAADRPEPGDAPTDRADRPDRSARADQPERETAHHSMG
jgi:undecaprenyl-diphosphatase